MGSRLWGRAHRRLRAWRTHERAGAIWLGLTGSVDSLRAYSTFAEFSRMVSRSAFAELRYSPLRLAGAIGGMALVYRAAAVRDFRAGRSAMGGAVTWAMMAIALARCCDYTGAPSSAALPYRPLRSPMSPSPSIPRYNMARARRLLERAISSADAGDRARVTTVKEALSGKGHRDENFPVASWLLSEQRRGPIMAFYRFVRAADDVADQPTLTPKRSSNFSTISTMRLPDAAGRPMKPSP